MLEVGRQIERYTVEAAIGEGGVAQVFRVRHRTLGTLHALKVLKWGGGTMRERLVREGQLQASIRHDNIVAVTDVIDVDGAPGLLMEFVAGPSVEVWLSRNAPTWTQAELLFRGILAGVAQAHSAGLIHRDLKPGNVLLAEGRGGLVPKVADFGLAKIVLETQGGSNATRTGVAMGTPPYMSPEQIRDTKNVDRRTDIWALGCILYELACGRSPFAGTDMLSIFSAVTAGRYVAPESVAPDMPAHLVATIRACLSVDRDRRPASCAEVLALLDERPALVTGGMPGSAVGEAVTWEGSVVGPGVHAPTAVPAPGSDATSPRARYGVSASAVRRFAVVLVLGALGLVAAWSYSRATGVPVVATPAAEDPPPLVPDVASERVVSDLPPPLATPVVTAPAGPRRQRDPVVTPVDVAAPPAAVAAAPATGSVLVEGDATRVTLRGGDGLSRAPGVGLPVGTYDLQATFGNGVVISRPGLVTVRADAATTVRCSAAVESCR